MVLLRHLPLPIVVTDHSQIDTVDTVFFPFSQLFLSSYPVTTTLLLRWFPPNSLLPPLVLGRDLPALLVHRHLQDPQQTLEAMLRPKVTTLPGHIQAVYVQNVVKLYAAILQQKEQAADAQAAQEVTQLLVERLPQFVQSADLEVQERVGGGSSFPRKQLHLGQAMHSCGTTLWESWTVTHRGTLVRAGVAGDGER